MAELPTEVLAWAENVVDEVVNINGVDVLVRNKVEPDASFKASGLLAREPLGRSRFNWFNDLTSRYIKHLVEKDAVGTVHMQTNNEPAVTVSERLGGTWVNVGSDTIAGTTVYVYEKTAL